MTKPGNLITNCSTHQGCSLVEIMVFLNKWL